RNTRNGVVLSLNLITQQSHVTPNVRVTGGVRYTNLEGDIENSPILESGINMAANVGVAYVF
ncbi:MipA/OmpV family protein, partial [Vibrio sp. 10N.239.312.C11]|uniref:MipA/OmpV family protein n=1 Tax=Vibrio sp. 10N.239.312.C11 TaxID=3229977 RepID=UPI00354E35E5